MVEVEGTVQRSEKAQRGVELLPSRVTVISRAEVPLPLGVIDKVGAELDTRFNHRVIDLRKPSVRAIFELRSALLAGFRSAFLSRDFIEIETPKLLREGAEGGATLFPVDYFETRAYLAQSPQLYKQMLMSAGFERVFEIAPAWRAEPSDTVRHLTEFTSLDLEVAYPEGADGLRTILEEVLVDALRSTHQELAARKNPLASNIPDVRTPFPRIPFARAEEWLGRPGAEQDFGSEDEKAIGARVQNDFGVPFYYLIDYPTAVKSHTFYAQRQDGNPRATWYCDLDFRGWEIASGGLREHRIDRLRENFVAAGLDPERFGGYLEAFRYGMPPHGGFGFGVDRLITLLAGLSNIREARLFPRDRYRLDP